MPPFVAALSRVFRPDRQDQPEKEAATRLLNPDAFVVYVRGHETALSRFVKRLSASGAGDLHITQKPDAVFRIAMRPPHGAADWHATVAHLIDRCELRQVEA